MAVSGGRGVPGLLTSLDDQVDQVAQVDVQDAETQLSKLLKRVEAGEEIVLARSGRPIARLVPIEAAAPRRPGLLAGAVDDAFLDDLPEQELRAWEGS